MRARVGGKIQKVSRDPQRRRRDRDGKKGIGAPDRSLQQQTSPQPQIHQQTPCKLCQATFHSRFMLLNRVNREFMSAASWKYLKWDLEFIRLNPLLFLSCYKECTSLLSFWLQGELNVLEAMIRRDNLQPDCITDLHKRASFCSFVTRQHKSL